MTYAKGQGAANPTTLVVTDKSSPAAAPQGTAGPATAAPGDRPSPVRRAVAAAYLARGVSIPSPRI